MFPLHVGRLTVSASVGLAAAAARLSPSSNASPPAAEAVPRDRQVSPRAPLQHFVTPTGKFTMLSETATHPSTPLMFLALGGERLRAEETARVFDRALVQRFPRFRSRLIGGFEQPRCFEETDVTAADMVGTLEGEVGSEAALAELFEGLYFSRFDPDRPLWEARLVPLGGAFRKGAGAATGALVFRAHHILADGVSLASAFSGTVDEAAELERQTEEAIAEYRRRLGLGRRRGGILGTFLRLIGRALGMALGSVVGLLHHLSVLFRTSRALTLVPGRRGRRFGWRANCISVAEAKRVAKSLSRGATVNDVVLACVAGALAKQVAAAKGTSRGANAEHSRGANAKGISVAAALPLHLYGGVLPKGQPLGNRIGAVTVALPAGGDPVANLRGVAAEMKVVKSTPMAFLSHYGAAAMSALVPASLATAALQLAAGGAEVAVSNVRGPAQPLHLLGRPIQAIVGFVPPPPGTPVGVFAGSYNGALSLSANVDPEYVPDAQRFVDDVLEAWEQLAAAERRRAAGRAAAADPLKPTR